MTKKRKRKKNQSIHFPPGCPRPELSTKQRRRAGRVPEDPSGRETALGEAVPAEIRAGVRAPHRLGCYIGQAGQFDEECRSSCQVCYPDISLVRL